MEHEPCGLLSDAKCPCDFATADTVFAVEDEPHCREPFVQAERRLLEDGSNLDRELPLRMPHAALPAQLILQESELGATAGWAGGDTVRENTRNEIVQAVFRVGKVNDRFFKSPWFLAFHTSSVLERRVLVKYIFALFYPHLDFAREQSRSDSGVLIRDLVFYNTQSEPFLTEIRQEYGSKQLVFEMKNVRQIDRDHINQLNRYLADPFGGFGVLVTRNPLPRPMFRNTIDLWSGQRRCILALTDEDIHLMVQLFESRQRNPIDVLKRNYVEFRRTCPS